MNGPVAGLIAVYAVATLALGVCAGLSAATAVYWRERRALARIALTCWAWPIWLLVGLWRALAYLIREAGLR